MGGTVGGIRLFSSALALAAAALGAGCSGLNYSSAPGPGDPLVSAEDLALQTAGVSLVRAADYQVLRATGTINAGVTQYRTLLGIQNLNTAGEQPAGRREINWDGASAALTNVDTFPKDFFNVKSPRGVLFSTNGTGFRVSDNGYADLNTDYTGEFKAFSPSRLFIAAGSNTMDVTFVVAGSNTPALVTGFGAVFADVGHSAHSTITYYDANGVALYTATAPVRSDATGLSFAGVVFDSPKVAHVRIVSGDAPLSATTVDLSHGSGKLDLVALDDFIYGEPHARAQAAGAQ